MSSNIPVEFVHIGLPKTGSTWLQRSLFDKHPSLQVIGVKNKFHPLSSFNEIIRFLYAPIFDANIFVSQLQAILHLLNTEQKLGVSNESLSGYPLRADLAIEVANRIKVQLGDVNIIIVLRNPVTLIQSAYIQTIKSGFMCNSFDDFMQDEENRHRLAFRVDYSKLLSCYRELFGRVLVLPFELLVHSPQDFSDRICDFLGVEHYTVLPQAHNTTLPYVIQELMRQTNRIDLTLWPRQRYIARLFWPSVNKRMISLRKMKDIGLEYYLEYPEFDMFRAQNYQIWQGELAKYNYFAVNAS